jgi:hypothetical protein
MLELYHDINSVCAQKVRIALAEEGEQVKEHLLAKHFSDEEIIELGPFCAEVDGVGKFVKSLDVMGWEEACELSPKVKADAAQMAAE